MHNPGECNIHDCRWSNCEAQDVGTLYEGRPGMFDTPLLEIRKRGSQKMTSIWAKNQHHIQSPYNNKNNTWYYVYGNNHSTRKAICTIAHPSVCRQMVPHHWSDITKRADEGSRCLL